MEKKLFLVILLVLNFSFSQTNNNTIDYIVVMKEGYNLDYTKKSIREDSYFSFELQNDNLKEYLRSIPVYEIKKEFTTARTPYLQRVYRISTNSEELLSSLINRNEFEYVEKYEAPKTLDLPNDFNIPIDGERNTALDLIRATMAWGVTTGSSNVVVGITDTSYEIAHEDLEGQIVANLNAEIASSTMWGNHGTQVAGMFAKTNNDTGSSSVGFNTKIVITTGLSVQKLLLLSQQPNVRVVNASWLSNCTFSPIENAVIQEIINGTDITPPVVVVAAAGNINTCGNFTNYIYPASYPGVISVGGINHWQPRNTTNPDPSIGNRFWEDICSIEPLNQNSSNTTVLNDRIDVLAPAWRVYGPGAPGVPNTPGYSENAWNEYWRHSGTSIAAPITAGVAALMLSINPSLTPAQVRQIIKDTADEIYHIPENQGYAVLQNIGRLNAFRAVTEAKCLLETNHSVDLLIRDNDGDYGQQPNNSTNVMWNSPEIWVRNQPDGKRIRKHQNPTYSVNNNTNYMYVRVYNRGCTTSSGNDVLKVYWAKASTALSWPHHWNGTGNFPNNGPLLGAPIGQITIPQLQRGEDVILEIPWQVPNPDIYVGINQEPWHFCLLARIESNDDSISTPETSNLVTNVNSNNNIAWKNLTIISIPPAPVSDGEISETSSINGVIAVGNNHNEIRDFALEIDIDNETSDYNKKLFEESEITLIFDENLFNQWVNEGKIIDNLEEMKTTRTLLVKSESSKVSKIRLLPNQIGTINFKFNFLTKELLNKKGKFVMNVIQRDLVTNEIVGGETFNIEKYQRTPFYANAGDDKLVDRNEMVIFTAHQIDKEAVYNWYDEEGNLIYSGIDFQVISDISRKFKLEIISLSDGFKDYAEVNLDLKNNHISSLYPNPSNNIINLELKLNHLDNNYIMITGVDSHNNNNVYNYIIDNKNTLSIDVSNYLNGNYVISFVHNGQITDSKIFIKN